MQVLRATEDFARSKILGSSTVAGNPSTPSSTKQVAAQPHWLQVSWLVLMAVHDVFRVCDCVSTLISKCYLPACCPCLVVATTTRDAVGLTRSCAVSSRPRYHQRRSSSTVRAVLCSLVSRLNYFEFGRN